MAGFVLTHSKTAIDTLAARCSRVAPRADVGAGVDALARRMHVGKHQVLGAASQDGVGALLVIRKYEQLGALQAADQQISHLRRGLAASEAVHINAANAEQL